MEVKLKILNGRNAGQALSLVGPKFVVGRAQGCQLRPHSSSVAEHHCEFELLPAGVTLRDLGSASGTLVNDEKIAAPVQLSSGDRLKIGPLEFEVVIKFGLAAKKKPKVSGAGEAAARLAAGSAPRKPDEDIDDWLSEPTEDTPMSRYAAMLTDEERLRLGLADEDVPAPPPASETPRRSSSSSSSAADAETQGKGKPADGKPTTADPRSTAADMLSKYMNRR